MRLLHGTGLLLAAVAVAAADPPAPHPTLALRYPRPRRPLPAAPPLRVTESRDRVVLESERCRLVFSRTNLGVVEAVTMGRPIPVRCVPDAMLIDEAGKVYHQAAAIDGQLTLTDRKDEPYLQLQGFCTPSGPQGPAPFRLVVAYDVHKLTGFIQVRVALDPTRSVGLRELAMQHSMGAQTLSRFPWLQVADRERGSRAVTDPPARPGLIAAGPLPFALWTDGATGFEVTGGEFRDCSFEPAFLAPDAPHLLTVTNHRDNARAIDMWLVRRLPGREIRLDRRRSYAYGMSFLPWRKFRPRFALTAATFDRPVGPGESAAAQEPSGDVPDPGAAARRGVTAAASWSMLGPPSAQRLEDVLHWTAQANRFGMQSIRTLDLRGLPPLFRDPREPMWQRLRDYSLWYPADQVREDLLRETWLANPAPAWPEQARGAVALCPQSERARRFLYDHVRAWLELVPTGVVRLEGMNPGVCTGEGHGCSTQGTVPAIGQHVLVERIRQLLRERAGTALAVAAGQAFHNGLAGADFTNPGTPPGVPSGPESAISFNPFLRGTAVIWDTAAAGGHPVKDLRLYERALARCGLISFNEGEREFISEEQRRWSERYMSPLGAWNIEDSTVHHPLEPDYGAYVQANLGRITPVLYEREDDLLLVVVKNADFCEPEPVTLDAKTLQWTERKILVFNTVQRTLRKIEEKKDTVSLGKIPVDEGPQILRIMRNPSAHAIVWHDQNAWRVVEEKRDSGLKARLLGVPDATALVYVYYHGGRPGRVDGGSVAAHDRKSKLLTLSVTFDSGGLAGFHVR